MRFQIGAFFPTRDMPADRVAIRDWARQRKPSASISSKCLITCWGPTGPPCLTFKVPMMSTMRSMRPS